MSDYRLWKSTKQAPKLEFAMTWIMITSSSSSFHSPYDKACCIEKKENQSINEGKWHSKCRNLLIFPIHRLVLEPISIQLLSIDREQEVQTRNRNKIKTKSIKSSGSNFTFTKLARKWLQMSGTWPWVIKEVSFFRMWVTEINKLYFTQIKTKLWYRAKSRNMKSEKTKDIRRSFPKPPSSICRNQLNSFTNWISHWKSTRCPYLGMPH